ncbi:type II toxin-antitoxin system HipA family toxin, partial [Enterobacter hormaechei]
APILDYDDFHASLSQSPCITLFYDHGQPGWLRFIDDIIPAGASRRYGINALTSVSYPLASKNSDR